MEPSPLDLSFLRILWRRRYLILFSALVCFLLGVYQVNRSAIVYTSEAEIKYEPATSQIIDLGERSSMMYQRDEIRTAVQLIQTPDIALAVLDALGERNVSEVTPDVSPVATFRDWYYQAMRSMRDMIVPSHPVQFDNERLGRQNEARSLLDSISVIQRPDTKLIRVRVSRSNPMEASRICDEFCRQFIRSIAEEKRDSFSYAREYLEQQIEETKTRLAESEKKVYEFSGQSDMRLMSESRDIAINTMVTLSQKIEEEKINITTLKAEAEKATEKAQNLLVIEQDRVLGDLNQRKTALLVEKATLEAQNLEDYAPLARVRNEITALTTQIDASSQEYVKAYVAARESDLELAQSRLANLEQQLGEKLKVIDGLEERLITFRVLQREVDATREIFNKLLEQYNRLEVAEDASPSNVRVVRPASIPTAPSAPNVSRTLAMSLFSGFLLGAFVAMGLHLLDRSVRDPKLIEDRMGLPTLGMVPCLSMAGAGSFLGRKSKMRRPLAPFEENRKSVGEEAFRFLRTSIEYSGSQQPRVILVTSCRAEEGKSTISTNLSIFYGEQKRRTLLIDGDFKRPSIQRFFAISRVPGLSDVLTGKAELADVIQQTGFANLEVLPAGFSSPSPITLLESEAMKDVLIHLRGQYDQIIIDTCPSDGMADPFVLSTRVDGVILVVRHGSTPMESLNRVSEKMRTFGARILGVVYNTTDSTLDTPEYNYKYTYERRAGWLRFWKDSK